MGLALMAARRRDRSMKTLPGEEPSLRCLPALPEGAAQRHLQVGSVGESSLKASGGPFTLATHDDGLPLVLRIVLWPDADEPVDGRDREANRLVDQRRRALSGW
jgi:hypothetical protein